MLVGAAAVAIVVAIALGVAALLRSDASGSSGAAGLTAPRPTTTTPTVTITIDLTELSRLGDSTYITDEELEDAKKAREVNNALALEHTSATVQGLAFWWSVAGLDYYRTYVDRMREQTRHDLAMYAKRYIIGRPMSVGVLTTPEGTEEARQILRYVLGGGTATAGSAQ